MPGVEGEGEGVETRLADVGEDTAAGFVEPLEDLAEPEGEEVEEEDWEEEEWEEMRKMEEILVEILGGGRAEGLEEDRRWTELRTEAGCGRRMRG